VTFAPTDVHAMLDSHGWGVFDGHTQSWITVCIHTTAEILPSLGSHVCVNGRCDRSQSSRGLAIRNCLRVHRDWVAARESGEISVNLFVDLLRKRACRARHLRWREDVTTIDVGSTSCIGGRELINAFL